jgi:hypothetical protein
MLYKVEVGRLLLFEGTKDAVCCHSLIRPGTAKEAKTQFPKGCREFWLGALCNSAPKSSETREKHKNSASKASTNMEYVVHWDNRWKGSESCIFVF